VSDSEFTCEKPDEQAFLDTLVDYLKFRKEKEIADLLEGAQCRTESTSAFSYQRWDGHFHFVITSVKVESVICFLWYFNV